MKKIQSIFDASKLQTIQFFSKYRFPFLLGLTIFWVVRIPSCFGWDEAFYTTQMVSVFKDGNLLLHNNLINFPNTMLTTYRSITILHSSGSILNTFSIGPAVVYSFLLWPFLWSGLEMNTILFRGIFAVENMMLLIIAVYALSQMLKFLDVPDHIIRPAVICAIVSTPYWYYASRFYLTSHAPGTALIILAYWAISHWMRTPRYFWGITSGVFSGLVVIIRWQDVILLFPLAILYLRKKPNIPWLPFLLNITLSLASFGCVIFIQLLAWKIQFGKWFLMPQGQDYMHWANPKLIPFLFSGFHGVLYWAPGVIIGLFGFIFWIFRKNIVHRWFFIAGLISILISIYICACVHDWWGGFSYGPRRLSSTVPLIAIGFSLLLKNLPRTLIWMLVIIMVVWGLMTGGAIQENLDDMVLLFRGYPDKANPYNEQQYKNLSPNGLRNLWLIGIGNLAKPGFTFSDDPDNEDRIRGLLTVCAMITILLILKNLLLKYKFTQFVLLSAGMGFILVWLGLLMFIIPDNIACNMTWKNIVHDPDNLVEPSELPDDMKPAYYLVTSVRSIRCGNMDDAFRFYPIITETLPMSFNEIQQFSTTESHFQFIDNPLIHK